MKLQLAIVLLSLVVVTECNPFVIAAGASTVFTAIVKAIEKTEKRSVIVENKGRHSAHLWCASKEDKIGGNEGMVIPPGNSLGWSFGVAPRTQFWCSLDWNGQRVGWDVFVYNWKDAPKIVKWFIRDDGIYDEWKGRKWRNLRSKRSVNPFLGYREKSSSLNPEEIPSKTQ